MTTTFKNNYRLHIMALVIFSTWIVATNSCKNGNSLSDHNKKLIIDQFKKWEEKKGSFFDLLTADAVWQVEGNGPGVISGVYQSKEEYMKKVVDPIQSKLVERLSPKMISILAEGNQVVVLWHGSSTAKDGKPYQNTYSWHLTIKNDRITNVIAFLDTYTLNELMLRVKTTTDKKPVRYE